MANSTVLVSAPPRDTPFFDKRSGRISESWLSWFGSISAAASIVQNLQSLQIIAEDNSTDGNSAAILAEILDAIALLAEPQRLPAPMDPPAETQGRDWSAEISELRALATSAIENANAWRAEVDELKAMLAAADVFPGAQVASMISSASPATGNLTESTSDILTITGGLGAVVGSGTSIQVAKASSSQDGYLPKGDWSTFNAKQAALGFTPLNPTNNLSDVASESSALGNLIGSWQSWTPTISGLSGMTASSVTVNDAQYLRIGPFILFKFSANITLGGTPSPTITITLPSASVGADELVTASFASSAASGNWVPTFAYVPGGFSQIYFGAPSGYGNNFALAAVRTWATGCYRVA